MVTHEPQVARRAERILIIKDGRIHQRLLADELEDSRVLSLSNPHAS